MGSVLEPAPTTSSAPTFLVAAQRDPFSADLERIQIIKGWTENGEHREEIFEVAGGDNGASVDLATCEPRGAGASNLCSVWKDPSFDAAAPAFYYARVIENPSCRWSARLCLELPVSERPDGCSDPRVPKTIQERAWTSPIWYAPAS